MGRDAASIVSQVGVEESDSGRSARDGHPPQERRRPRVQHVRAWDQAKHMSKQSDTPVSEGKQFVL